MESINVNSESGNNNESFVVSDIIASIAKYMNGDDVKVEDCIYHGKKKFTKEIKWT